MPNGRPDFDDLERPRLEQFFAPVADCLNHIGEKHNLLLTRYWHQEPCWDYMFRHPIGGGRIMIHQAGEDLLSVQGLLWVDQYERFTRFTRRSAVRLVNRDPKDLAPALRAALEEVLGWQEGNWDDIAGGYREVWSRLSKEEFEAAVTYYPIPSP